MTVAAVVVCHSFDDSSLSDTLEAINQQTKPPARVIIASNQPGPGQILISSTRFEDAFAEILLSKQYEDWLWILNAGQLPAENALEELLLTAESSTTAAIIAPKIMEPENPRLIRQYGLTLTPRGSLHQQVQSELDQAQHDSKQDALGVCLEGVLVSQVKVAAAGGAQTALNSLAADLELGIRLRLRGMRVLLSPAAKILGSDIERISPRTADHELKIFYYSALKSFMFWLVLPLLVVAEALWLMFRKQPEKIGGELGAGFKVFFTAAGIWLARKSLTRRERKSLRSLRTLYATKNEVRDAKVTAAALEPATSAIGLQFSSAPKFFSSGAAWLAVALLAVSWQFWPSNIDAAGSALLPLGDNWLNLFTATGSGFQNIGTGFFAPSDPFNWVLLALGSLTFWSPGLAMALLFFFAKSLAFATAFKVFSLATERIWLAILAGLSYAFWPTFSFAQAEARLPQIITHILLPVFVYAVCKVAGFKAATQSKPVTWSYTALAALVAAAIGACSPSLILPNALFLLAFAIYRFRRVGYFIWVPVPLLVLWLPTLIYRLVNFRNPLTVFADPSSPLASEQLSATDLLSAAWAKDWQLSNLIAIAVVIALGLPALNSKRKNLAAVTLFTGLVTLAAAWLFQQVQFVGNPVVGATGALWVNGSPHGLLSATGLAVGLMLVLALDESKLRRFAALFAYPAVCALAVFALLVPSSLNFNDGRVVPALIRAEAKQSSALKVLVLQPETDQRYSATIVSDDGVHLADLNASYRFALADQKFDAVAQVAAGLISASPEDLGERLKQLSIGYVLVSSPSSASGRNLVSNIDSVLGLNSLGLTDFGQLWRVAGITELPVEPPTNQDLWSVTKGVQLLVLLLFALLAIPTRRREVRVSQQQNLDQFDTEEADANV